IGHVLSLNIGGTDLTADLSSKNPMDDSDVKCVGIIREVKWAGGYTDPVEMTFLVSTTNKQTLAGMVHTALKSTAITCQWDCYEFDPTGDQGVYYKNFWSNDTALKGLIKKDSGKLALEVNKEPDGEVSSPMNYEIKLTYNPKPEQQGIAYAPAASKNTVKRWGSAN
ncbi:MAG TPA: hypothetical protein VHF22_10990, partial [Planctomycetota bacterium]|nr:hypothetical protein [Planctomycetota bacterium]